jgi:hypothetical protein
MEEDFERDSAYAAAPKPNVIASLHRLVRQRPLGRRMKARHNFLPRHAQIFHFARHATFRAAGLYPDFPVN